MISNAKPRCLCRYQKPQSEAAVGRYFLIAVTRGAHLAARQFFGGGSSGSVILSSDIRGKKHYEFPFHIGFPLESGRFVHVLDEMTVDLLLEELDTVPDLVAYLASKEAFLSKPGVSFWIPDKEEILARYMATMRDGQHALPQIPGDATHVKFPEGDWELYSKSAQRAAKREADKVNYLWDSIIEHHSNFIRAGTAITLSDQSPDRVEHERIVRAMAQQNRLQRRQRGADLHYVLARNEPRGVFTRIHMIGSPPTRAFVFLAAKRHVDMSYEEYRKSRMHYLTTYCNAIKESMPTLQEAIGVSAEPFSEGESSFEFIYVDHSLPMSDAEKKGWRDMADELEILRPKTQLMLYKDTEKEFPIPFNFGPERYLPFMSRAERRPMEREARKVAKKSR